MHCRGLVWLSRIRHSLGFGIQSPTDYAFVRYVVNEHWPYYAYDELHEDSWLRKKLGRLYLRLANWRQPSVILSDDYHPWFHAGCAKSILSPLTPHPSPNTQHPSPNTQHPTPNTQHPSPNTQHPSPNTIDLARIPIDQWDSFEPLMTHCDQQTVLVVEDIWRNPQQWQQITRDARTGTTFDLYYCGIVFFDTERYKHNYIINF